MTSINFTHSSPLGLRREAVCSLDIHGPLQTASLIDVLVDSGADYVMVPQLLARRTGISLKGARRIAVRGIGGTVLMYIASNVRIAVNGTIGTTDLLFNPSSTSMPVVGRNGIDLVKDIALSPANWHWN